MILKQDFGECDTLAKHHEYKLQYLWDVTFPPPSPASTYILEVPKEHTNKAVNTPRGTEAKIC